MCMSKPPAPAPLPDPPKESDAEVMARMEAERRKALAAQGMGATVITGGLGAGDFESAGKRDASDGTKTTGRLSGTNLLGQTA